MIEKITPEAVWRFFIFSLTLSSYSLFHIHIWFSEHTHTSSNIFDSMWLFVVQFTERKKNCVFLFEASGKASYHIIPTLSSHNSFWMWMWMWNMTHLLKFKIYLWNANALHIERFCNWYPKKNVQVEGAPRT